MPKRLDPVQATVGAVEIPHFPRYPTWFSTQRTTLVEPPTGEMEPTVYMPEWSYEQSIECPSIKKIEFTAGMAV